MNELDIAKVAERFEKESSADKVSTSVDLIRWGCDTFKDKLAIACSLGAEDMVIMDMSVKVYPNVVFLFLDTDFHFKDTLELLEEVKKIYKPNIKIVKPEITKEEQAKRYGENLFFIDPNLCCQMRKVIPIRGALSGYSAWITGIRRDQAPTRANTPFVERDKNFEKVKINPLVKWTWNEVWDYIKKNNVPYNRLHDMGYPSIGCAPCTQPVKPGEDLRAGRWKGTEKTECGLHPADAKN